MKLKDSFNHYVNQQAEQHGLVVQPRMGFSDWQQMRDGLVAVKESALPTIGTITVDAMTRQGLVAKARKAVDRGDKLNGYPLASYSKAQNQQLLADLMSDNFPVQVRHGTPVPEHVFQAAIAAGLTAIEGGPVSYALPYGRTLLKHTFPAWRESLKSWARWGKEQGVATHMESFAGCMMGQLCPPSLLVALGILEGLFIREQGIESLSLSLAQGTHSDQDIAALLALKDLMADYLPDVNSHIVAYTWMGVFPTAPDGAERLIRESARVATLGGAQRLIVKTIEEAVGIPSVASNLQALRWCCEEAANAKHLTPSLRQQELALGIRAEAEALITATLNLNSDIEAAIQWAFKLGLLDVPFCLHPDNRDEARASVTADGFIDWVDVGRLPIQHQSEAPVTFNSSVLLQALEYNRRQYA